MLPSRFLLYSVIILLILSYCCEAQNEIRNAVKTKTNRKINEGKKKIQRGKQAVRRVKDQAKAPFNQAGEKIDRKYQNTRRKIHAIEDVIKS
jgi:iron-sulfur cluster repair protein YtfE (RIC family)